MRAAVAKPKPKNPTLVLILDQMQEKRITPGRLARQVDRDPSHVYRVLTGERALSQDLAARLVSALRGGAR